MAKTKHTEEDAGEVVPLTRSIPLTDEERADRAKKLAKAVQHLELVEADAKAKRKAMKVKIDEAKAEVSRLASAVVTGQEKVLAQREMFDAN
jgi:hypothetical protein